MPIHGVIERSERPAHAFRGQPRLHMAIGCDIEVVVHVDEIEIRRPGPAVHRQHQRDQERRDDPLRTPIALAIDRHQDTLSRVLR